MKLCSCCGNPVIKGQVQVYKELQFCSVNCMDRFLLLKCKAGDISFLDLPREVRDRENGKHKTVYKCNTVECPVCNTIFYINYSFEGNRKYCSDKCVRIAMKPIREKNGLLNTGWLSKNWRGGISNGIYCSKFNSDLKRRVRRFFGEKCFLCGKPQAENSKLLSVHHVNYNKNQCCDSSKVMLVPLCQECHGKTNQNREYWEDYFENILKERYNYKCYYTKEEYNNLKSEECSS